MSEQIRKLEAELGVSLLTRTQRSVELTDAGAAMLEEARGVLAQAEVAQHAARQAHRRSIGRVRVGYLPDALPAAVPRLLSRFAAAAPGIDVRFETGGARDLIARVREERLDVAVVCLPAPVSGLSVVPIGNESAVAAVPDAHPCANEGRIAVGVLERTRLIQLPRTVNPAFHDSVISAFSQAGIAPTLIEAAEPLVEQVLLAVASGAGIALLPESAAKRYTMPGVRFRPVAPPAPTCEVAIVARAEPTTTTTAFLRLAQQVRRAGPELAAAS